MNCDQCPFRSMCSYPNTPCIKTMKYEDYK